LPLIQKELAQLLVVIRAAHVRDADELTLKRAVLV
jgi:hypothetical protein